MSDPRDLADQLDPGPMARIIRLGVVDAVATRSDGGAVYTVVTIHGRTMRILDSYLSPSVGETVVWLFDGHSAIALGTRL